MTNEQIKHRADRLSNLLGMDSCKLAHQLRLVRNVTVNAAAETAKAYEEDSPVTVSRIVQAIVRLAK